jgi:hypothetical protein
MPSGSPKNSVSLAVFEKVGQPPPKKFTDIPWFAGMRILDATVLCQAMNVHSFEFQVEYNSSYGAFVNQTPAIFIGWSRWTGLMPL